MNFNISSPSSPIAVTRGPEGEGTRSNGIELAAGSRETSGKELGGVPGPLDCAQVASAFKKTLRPR